MKKIKFISVLVMLSILFSLSACNKRETPEAAMEKAMQAILEMDEATMAYYFNNTDTIMNLENTGDTLDETESEYFQLFMKHFRYEIISTEEKDDTAVVTIEITNADMGSVLASILQQAFSELLSYAFLPEEQQLSDEEMDALYLQYFTNALNAEDLATVTNTVSVHMNYVEDHWKIEASEEFGDALLGGLVSSTKDLFNVKDTNI